MIAFLNMGNFPSLGDDNSSGLMAQQGRQTLPLARRPLHRVQLRVADTAGKELY